MRRTAALVLQSVLLLAQDSGGPSFEAASIKLTTASDGGSGITTTAGRISARNVTLRRCIRGAYDVPEAQIVGGPKWVDETRFDIIATAADGAGDRRLMLMLQTLLTERFALAIHRENRMLSGYALTLAKSGLKAKASNASAGGTTNASRGRIDATGCSMDQLALKLSAALSIPVQNATQTAGRFDFHLEWAPDAGQTNPPANPDPRPSIFAAVQEQLGLKLESKKLATEVIMVDRANLPSGN